MIWRVRAQAPARPRMGGIRTGAKPVATSITSWSAAASYSHTVPRSARRTCLAALTTSDSMVLRSKGAASLLVTARIASMSGTERRRLFGRTLMLADHNPKAAGSRPPFTVQADFMIRCPTLASSSASASIEATSTSRDDALPMDCGRAALRSNHVRQHWTTYELEEIHAGEPMQVSHAGIASSPGRLSASDEAALCVHRTACGIRGLGPVSYTHLTLP